MMAATDCEPLDRTLAQDGSQAQPTAPSSVIPSSTPPTSASSLSPVAMIPLSSLLSFVKTLNMTTDAAASNPPGSAVVPVGIPNLPDLNASIQNNPSAVIKDASLSCVSPVEESPAQTGDPCSQEASDCSTTDSSSAAAAQPNNHNFILDQASATTWPIPNPANDDEVYPFSLTHEGVTVSLKNSNLWRRFHKCGTEMIVSRPGRQMFPNCCYRLSGLDPDRHYSMVISVVPTSGSRYRCVASKWDVNGPADFLKGTVSRAIVHRNSPATGKRWMQSKLEFHKLKLTNDHQNKSGYMIIHSMHRYIPRLHVIPVPDGVEATPSQPVAMGSQSITFTFPQTEFMAVTCYQNVEVIQLKIDHNPLARSFKKGQRRATDLVDEDDDEDGDEVSSPVSAESSSNNNSSLAKGLKTGQKRELQLDIKKVKPGEGKELDANSGLDYDSSPESQNKDWNQKSNNTEDFSPRCKEGDIESKELLKIAKSPSTASPTPKPVLKNPFLNLVLKPISFSPQRKRVKYTPCIRGGLALGELSVVDDDQADPDERTKKRTSASDSYNQGPTSPESSTGSPGYRKRKKKTYNRTKYKAGANSPTVEPVATQPELDDVEGQLFASFTSKEHLDSHTKVDESKRPLEPLPAPEICTPSITPVIKEEVPETQEERLARFEESLKVDLDAQKHRQVIHPQLEKVGLKLNNLDSTSVCLDLQYLGVDLPPVSSPVTPPEAELSSAESHFVSRTGKTSDVTKIKGWKNKFAQSQDTSLLIDGSEKNLSPFFSNMLDQYLESEAVQISERAAAFSTTSQGSVAYQLPAQSSSYVKTLDSALKHRIRAALESPVATEEQTMDPSPPTNGQGGAKNHQVSPKNKKIRSDFSHIYGAKHRGPFLSKFHAKLQQMEMKAVSKSLERTELTAERLSTALSVIVTEKTLNNKIGREAPKEKGKEEELACGHAFCRLGCVCSSLHCWNKGVKHCQQPSCMFGCSCSKDEISTLTTEKIAEESPDPKSCMDHDYQSRRGLHSNKLWNKSIFDDDPEPLCVPANRLGTSTGVQGVDEGEKDPVYKYLESMMTCARVRPFDSPPVQPVRLDHTVFAPAGSKYNSKEVIQKDETSLMTVNLSGGSRSTEMQASKQIEIESACNWKKDQKMVLEGIFRQIEKKSLSEQFDVGPYCISPITRIFMRKPTGSFLTYRIRIGPQQQLNVDKDDDEDGVEEDRESDADEGDAKHEGPAAMFGVVPFMMGLSHAGLMVANKVPPGGRNIGRIQVNGKFYNHTKLLLGNMGALHPANRLAAYITGRVKRTQVVPPKSSTTIITTTAAAAPVTVESKAVVVSTQAAATSTAAADTLASLTAKVQNVVAEPTSVVGKKPSAPLLLYVPSSFQQSPSGQKSLVTSPVSLTVSSSLKPPSFLEQSGTSTFRIYPPKANGAKGPTVPGLSLPGGFTVSQLPNPGRPESEVKASGQTTPGTAEDSAQKTSSSDVGRKPLNHSSLEPGEVRMDPYQECTSDEDCSDSSESEADFVDIETVKEDQGKLVDKLKQQAICEQKSLGTKPAGSITWQESQASKRNYHIEMERQRRSEQRKLFTNLESVLMTKYRSSKLHLLDLDKSDNAPKTSPRRTSHVETERQRRSEQRKLFGNLQSTLRRDVKTPKIHLLAMTLKEIKNLQETTKRLEKTKEKLLLQQKQYLKQLEDYAGTQPCNSDVSHIVKPEKEIEETPSDVSEKQKLQEKNMEFKPYFSNFLQSKAALLEVITPTSKEAMTPLLVPNTPLGKFKKDQSEAQSSVLLVSTKNNTVPTVSQRSVDGVESQGSTDLIAKASSSPELPADQPHVQEEAEKMPLLVTMDPEEARAHWNSLNSLPEQKKDQNSPKLPQTESLPDSSLKDDKELLDVKKETDEPDVKLKEESSQVPARQEKPSGVGKTPSRGLPRRPSKPFRVILPYVKPGQDTTAPKDATTDDSKTLNRSNGSVLSSGCTNKDAQDQQKTAPGNDTPETTPRRRGRPKREGSVQVHVEAKRPRGRPVKSKTLQYEVNFDRLFRNTTIPRANERDRSSRPRTRASLGKDFPSEKRRSWVDIELDLDVESEVDIEGFETD